MTGIAFESFLNRRLNEKYPPKKIETDAILNLFKETITPNEAATRYASDVNSSHTKKEVNSKLWRIWILLQDVAAQFPEQHDRLAEMVMQISRLPDLVLGNEVAVKWLDLPVLSWQWSEGVLNWGFDIPLSSRINAITFTAKLSLLHVAGCDFTAASETAFWNAFEKSPDDATKLNRTAISSLEEGTLLVKEWVRVAGKEIYECEEQTGLPKEGLWTGKKGFSKARWEFWKQRAWWISEQQVLSTVIREAAKEIRVRMEEIELAQYN